MAEFQGNESVVYPACVFNYGNGRLISIGYGGELYVRKSEKDARLEVIGRRIAELESLVRDFESACGGLCTDCEWANPCYPDESDDMCLLTIRMRELGIEVS